MSPPTPFHTHISGIIIVPIYKNKGDPANAANYRPITILSCLGKLFTSVLNYRLTNYLDMNSTLLENQAGFRKEYSCQDHIFTLHSMIEILRQKKQKLYCAFIDFSAAFDKVHRISLWQKLLRNSINGKLFQVIYNMYSNIKSCVSHKGTISSFFACEIGVRQGENLSPVLFSLFLNDMQEFIQQNGGTGIDLADSPDETQWLKLLLLLYADDTVILSDSASDFQNCLNAFNDYCKLWHLNVNLNKTKIIIFGARKTRTFDFKLGDTQIEITDKYHYLGITFSSSGSFLNCRKHIVQQAKKAMYALFTKANNAELPLDLTLKLFDHTVLPILTYGSEIFGFENLDMLEAVHNDFLRKLTKSRKSTPIYMLHGELGRYPIAVTIKSRMIAFWSRMLSGDKNKLSFCIYNYMLHLRNNNFKWMNKIKNILETVGRPDIWINQGILPVPKNLHKYVKQIVVDQYIQEWNAQLRFSNKGRIYNSFKTMFQLEPYTKILPLNYALTLFRFRTSNHKFPIETGRWDGTALLDRYCQRCNNGEVGSEQHYLLNCSSFDNERRFILTNLDSNINIAYNEYCFKSLLCFESYNDLIQICKLTKIIMKQFS